VSAVSTKPYELTPAKLVADQIRGDLALQHLLDQIERVRDLPNLGDAAIAKGIESRHFDLHNPAVVGFAEEETKKHRCPVALDDEDRHFVTHLGVAVPNGFPMLADGGLAVVMSHMRQDTCSKATFNAATRSRRVREKKNARST
jgi:hypothetical protein